MDSPTTCIDTRQLDALKSFIKDRIERFEKDAGAKALFALRAEYMTVNPPDAKREKEDALRLAGHSEGLRDALNTIGNYLS